MQKNITHTEFKVLSVTYLDLTKLGHEKCGVVWVRKYPEGLCIWTLGPWLVVQFGDA